jgi:peptidoglycan/xylan/chitin deacetylase (PgdA/CDA1 family)
LRFPWALALIVLLPALARTQPGKVAMTVDDLPYASGTSKPLTSADAASAILINRKIIRSFSRRHIPVTGFVIEQDAERLGTDNGKKILKQWLRSGFDLGNHTYSHADADALTVDQFESEIIRGEATIAPLLQSVSRKPDYFRFPYNHTGDTREKHDAIAAFIAARGYRLAPCTIDNSDYEFNTTYVVALERHDSETAARVRAAYVVYTAAEIDWYSKLDQQVFGDNVPHVMLLHDSWLNADTIQEIIALFDKRGYRFVSLPEALQDPAYATPETYITKFGPMWGYRWAKERNVKVDGKDEPEPPAWIGQYVKQSSVATD